MKRLLFFLFVFILTFSLCDSDDESGNANSLGVGAMCAEDGDCITEGQSCLTDFSGGYCGSTGCNSEADCPEGSTCVTHTDDVNYCFLTCDNKSECNENRDEDNEANCSSSITLADENDEDTKACVPPSA